MNRLSCKGVVLSNVFSDVLSCHSCSRRAQLVADDPVCGSCGNRAWTDDRGILHVHQLPCRGGRILFDEKKESVPGLVPGSRTQQLETLRRRLADPAADLRRRLGDGYWNWLSYFNPNRYGYALLGAAGRGTRSLVLCSGWGELVRLISQLGGEAIGIDEAYDGLLYSAAVAADPNQGFIHSDDLLSLPFRDGCFDNVFWDALAGVTPYSPDNPHQNRELRERTLLDEANRVLKPGGRLLLAAPNSASLWRYRAPVSPFAAIERVSGGPQDLRIDRSSASTGTKLRSTQLGYLLTLRRAGFRHVAFNTLWPDPFRWRRLVLSGKSRVADPLHQRGSTLKERVREKLARGLSRVGLSSVIAPGYCIVATKTAESGDFAAHKRSPSALEAIAKTLGIDGQRLCQVNSQPNSHTLSLVPGEYFVKIPLTAHAENSLSAASNALSAISEQAHQLAGSLVAARLERVNGTAISVSPYISIRADHSWEDRVARLRWALDQLALDAHRIPLRETDLWNRLTSEEAQVAFADLGAPELLHFLEHRVAHKEVFAGVVHGDLVHSNVIRGEAGAPMIIDWDDVEMESPKLLDAIRACYNLARVLQHSSTPEHRGSDGIVTAWNMVLERDPRLPLLDRVNHARGELTWREAVGVALLDYIERRLRFVNSSPVRRINIEPSLRAPLELARACVMKDGEEDPATSPGG